MSSETQDLAGREVLVCFCGGIAAYKVCEVVSRLVQRGAGVTAAMTRAARQFIGPATLEALTARRVLTHLWSPNQIADSPHIRATSTAHCTLVAPATANILGKIAHGIADDVVSTLVIGAAGPVVFAPAMNDRMWNNPLVQNNVQTLLRVGYIMAPPKEGWLACRSIGMGRMADPEQILETVVALISRKSETGQGH